MASPQPTWGTGFVFPTRLPVSFMDQTLRQVVRISLGGKRVRLVFSNVYGAAPLKIGGASLGLAGQGSVIAPGTLHKLTFDGEDGVIVPPGASATSDPADLAVAPEARLSVSIFLPDKTPLTTFHWDARQGTLPRDQSANTKVGS